MNKRIRKKRAKKTCKDDITNLFWQAIELEAKEIEIQTDSHKCPLTDEQLDAMGEEVWKRIHQQIGVPK